MTVGLPYGSEIHSSQPGRSWLRTITWLQNYCASRVWMRGGNTLLQGNCRVSASGGFSPYTFLAMCHVEVSTSRCLRLDFMSVLLEFIASGVNTSNILQHLQAGAAELCIASQCRFLEH